MVEPYKRSAISQDPAYIDYVAAMGYMATLWAEYEFAVNTFIWEVANVERIAGSCLTSQMIGPGPRFRCLLSLLELRAAPATIINAFNSHASQAEKLSRQRNRFVHDPILFDPQEKQIHRMEVTADKHVRHDFVPTEVAELTALSEKIGKLCAEFDSLAEQAIAKSPAWPKTQFERSTGIVRHRKAKSSSA